MGFRMSQVAAAACLALVTASANAVPLDFGGYMRTGAGTSSKGGKELCFRLPGAEIGFFRLGNECDTYVSLDLKATLGEVDGTSFKAVFTMAYGTQQLANWEQSAPSWRQTYVEASDIGASLGVPALKGTALWAGKRFYKNPDIHMLDYTYLEPAMSPGLGLDNINVGIGNVSYALLRTGDFTGYGTNPNLGGFNPDIVGGGARTAIVHDLRLQEIPVNPGGKLTLGVSLVQARNRSGTSDYFVDRIDDPDGDGQGPVIRVRQTFDNKPGKNGSGLTVSHTQDDLFGLGGKNNVVLQYVRNALSLKGFGFAGSTDERKEWLLFDHWGMEPRQWPVTAALVAGVHNKEVNGASTRTVFAGARPQYHFNNVASLAFEAGYQQVKPEGQPTRKLAKLTIAPQFSMGRSLWSRPAFRLYYTHAKWNAPARDAGTVVCTGRDCATAVSGFETETEGNSFGFQVEAWF